MSLPFFLYRRLAKFITCRLRIGAGEISLDSKYDVASLQDVFCGPYYWQLYSLLSETPPKTVVDAGANVGHFSILANCCIETKFSSADTTRFILIEPNDSARTLATKNLKNAGMSGRSTVLRGLLGKRKGSAALHIDPKNFLTSSVVNGHGERGAPSGEVPYLDLGELVQGNIDILKVDVEGSEYDFITENPDVLMRTKMFLLELHETEAQKRDEMLRIIQQAGLHTVVGPILLNGQELFVFDRDNQN